MTTALVLGAGGRTGQAYHLGLLTALHDLTGFDRRRADVVVGTSAGSLVAAGIAGGLSAADQGAALSGEPLSRETAAVRFAVRRILAREVRQLRRHGATVVVFQPTAGDLTAMGRDPMRLLRANRVMRTVADSVRSRLEAQPGLVETLAAG